MAGFASTSIDVSMEAVIEYPVREISFGGQEIYTLPPTMSQKLINSAHMIDFSNGDAEEKRESISETEEKDDKDGTSIPKQSWPWDSVRTKLQEAQTEVSVLADIIAIATGKKFMVLDPIIQDPPEAKNNILLMSRKRNLQAAGKILVSGAEYLKKPQFELGAKRPHNFHKELLQLRKNWKLRKVGNTILGDVSYRSCGSKFALNGTFEVIKTEENMVVDLTDSPTPPKPSSVLQVKIPSELDGVAYIQVAVKQIKDNMDLSSIDLRLPTNISGAVPSDSHWQVKLEAAQNVIFCKEVFQQLAHEAVVVKTATPHMVVGNQIFSHLFPGLQLSIALVHGCTDKNRHMSSNVQQRLEHDHVLEHSLHQLLHQMHHKLSFFPMPHPASGILGVTRKRAHAGPKATSQTDLYTINDSETLLEQVIKQARHAVLKQRAMIVIDSMASSIQDPLITAHWSNISTPTSSHVKISISSLGYEVTRTPIALHIGVDKLKAVCRDGRVIHLSHEEKELRDFILCQVATHNISVIQTLCRITGWSYSAINVGVGVGEVELLGNKQTCIIQSPYGDKTIAIQSGAKSGLAVKLKDSPTLLLNEHDILKDSKYTVLTGEWKSVSIDRIDGHNFISRMEQLMAWLVPEKVPLNRLPNNISELLQ